MKQLAKSLMVVGAMVAAGSASAHFIDDICPVIGVDYQHVWMKGKSDWSTIFPKSYSGGTVYVGTRWDECFGFELGYDWAARKSRDFSFAGGSTLFGNLVPAEGISGRSTVRRTGGHFDLIGYLPVADCLELMGVVGIGWVHPRVSITAGPTPLSALSSALISTSGRTKAVPRVRLGANYMLTECVGVRALVGWEGTTSLRVRGNDAFGAFGFPSKAWKSSTTLAAGLFVKF